MKRTFLVIAAAIAILLAGCDSAAPDSEGQDAPAATATLESAAPTASPKPTETPAPSATPTETPVPSPTPDPFEPFLGVWECNGCTINRLDFYAADGGLQLQTWWNGAQHDWIGPAQCNSVHMSYFECSVSVAGVGGVTVFYIMDHFTLPPACRQNVEFGLQLQGSTLSMTYYNAWKLNTDPPCEVAPIAAGQEYYRWYPFDDTMGLFVYQKVE
jgi:hypothetical protein